MYCIIYIFSIGEGNAAIRRLQANAFLVLFLYTRCHMTSHIQSVCHMTCKREIKFELVFDSVLHLYSHFPILYHKGHHRLYIRKVYSNMESIVPCNADPSSSINDRTSSNRYCFHFMERIIVNLKRNSLNIFY